MAMRGQFAGAFSGRLGALFMVEIVLGGIVPLALLARPSRRPGRPSDGRGPAVAAGVVLNRVNVVLLAMNLKGPMPQFAPEPYFPSLVEWGMSIGLIAATIFLFGLGARLWPVLPQEPATARPSTP